DLYAERVYAGVLGKMVGVYLGRPFEQWPHERIAETFGEVEYYVHEKVGHRLVVADDDLSGTFTFVRAVEDSGQGLDFTSDDVAQAWLNYAIEGRSIFWWGGMGVSTEHTAYLRLKSGDRPPISGSIDRNGPVVAEQIGAQIFIDAFPMLAPGDPERAADLATRAACVGHDGEAVFGARCLAAMESAAFAETDIDRLIDTGLSVIPSDSTIAAMIADLRNWHAVDGDWHRTRARLVDRYGYGVFGGGCHVVPNHAVIILGLLYGEGDFQKSLKVCNTAGYDTDCNSGNLGCLLGLRGGLEVFRSGPDWLGPAADRMLLPTADGGRCVTDAAREALAIVNIARVAHGLEPMIPKSGARFPFCLPGAVHGFAPVAGFESRAAGTLAHNGRWGGKLRLGVVGASPGCAARWETPTFVDPAERGEPGYGIEACPTLYSGQNVKARLEWTEESETKVQARFRLRVESADGQGTLAGPALVLSPGESGDLEWTVPDTGGWPILALQIEAAPPEGTRGRIDGALEIDWVTWDGAPRFTFGPGSMGPAGPAGWVSTMDGFWRSDRIVIVSNHGTGLATVGTAEWSDYVVEADFSVRLASRVGLVSRCVGLNRYVAFVLSDDDTVQVVKTTSSGTVVLAGAPMEWPVETPICLRLECDGDRYRGLVDGKAVVEATDAHRPFRCGASGILLEEGRIDLSEFRVRPLE
ncbi:MAG: ADP-ribosylglycohydrolase family protein, partial [Fimbriimonadaceae bacterium]